MPAPRRQPDLQQLTMVSSMSERTQRFFDIWSSQRIGSAIPLLSDIKVPMLGELAAYCSLTQRLSRTKTIYRFCGTQMERVYRDDLTGIDITDIVKPEIAPQLTRASNFTMDYPCGAYIRELITFESGSEAHATTLTLPVAEPDGRCNNMLSSSGV